MYSTCLFCKNSLGANEAIEQCERSFRGTKLRTSTEEIGLARLTEGLELVRIGKPLRPEFAAWRYYNLFLPTDVSTRLAELKERAG